MLARWPVRVWPRVVVGTAILVLLFNAVIPNTHVFGFAPHLHQATFQATCHGADAPLPADGDDGADHHCPWCTLLGGVDLGSPPAVAVLGSSFAHVRATAIRPSASIPIAPRITCLPQVPRAPPSRL